MTQRVSGLRGLLRYGPLLKNLIRRELKKKYRASLLGYAWCVLNPLLIMLIMTVVFSQMFHNSIENYPVYLFVGRLFFTFVTGGVANVLRTIVNNGALMRKTRIPYVVFPLAGFFSVTVDFLFQLAAFAIVLAVTRTPISLHILAFPLVLLQAMLFTFGLGLLLAVAYTFARDVSQLWSVFCSAWMYLSALFYPLSSLPEFLQRLIKDWNPLYWLIGQGRQIFLEHVWPDPVWMLKGFLFGGAVTLLAMLAYRRAQDDLILYV